MAGFKSGCDMCSEGGFKSRVEWLFHLVSDIHSWKARENMQMLYLESGGNMFVISDIGEVHKSMLLDYVARIPSLRNFVCFRPQANVCIMACDEGDFTTFAATPHVICGVQPKFRDYNEIPPAEWKSYFTQNKTEVKKEKTSKEETGASTSTYSNGANSTSVKRNGGGGDYSIDVQQEHKIKHPKLDFAEGQSQNTAPVAGSSRVEDPTYPANANVKPLRWTDDLNQMNEFVMMPEAGMNARIAAICRLRMNLRPIFPRCELINVGADFLGFNLAKEELTIFFDWKGLTNPNSELGTVRNVQETDLDVQNTQIRLSAVFRSLTDNGSVKDVNFGSKDRIEFIYIVGQLPLKCTLLLKPFKLAQTVLLCKHLFFLNHQSTSLIKMVVYWTVKHGFEVPGLHNYYSIYWLVYFYLIQTKAIGPLIDLQKSCNYQIIDKELNVAFSYNPSLLSQMAARSFTSAVEDGSTKPEIELLLDWLRYTIQAFGDVHGNVASRRTSLICPRYGQLIDKVKFRVARGTRNLKNNVSDQQLQQWTEDLKNVGFGLSTWPWIGRLALPDTMSIQHPFYIDENISLDFNGPYAKRFFKALRKTKQNLTQFLKLPANQSDFSFLNTLNGEKVTLFQKGKKGHTAVNEQPCDFTLDEEEEKDPEKDYDHPDSNGSNLDSEDETATCDPDDGDDEVDTEVGDVQFSLPTVHPSYISNWTNEINNMFNSVTLSDDERMIRAAVVADLKTIVSSIDPLYRSCRIIPLGADFLGFKTKEQVFNFYLDSCGSTDPNIPSKIRTIDESKDVIGKLQHLVVRALNASGSVKELTTDKFPKNLQRDGIAIRFVCAVRGYGELRCKMLLAPFKSAVTALLCKQIFMTNPRTVNLVTMIMYWAGKRNDFADFLPNPFILVWLVYFFLINKNILPPVLELQKMCDFKITDSPVDNVAFAYDPNVLNPIYQRFIPSVSENNLIQSLELLVEFFLFTDKLGSPSKRRHSVICPRAGKVIDKKDFKVCKDKRCKKKEYLSATGNEKKRKSIEYLLSLGYDPSLWFMLARQRLRDEFIIQHPFYLFENICCKVRGPQIRAFFTAIKQTKENLTSLAQVVGTQPNVSLTEALSSF